MASMVLASVGRGVARIRFVGTVGIRRFRVWGGRLGRGGVAWGAVRRRELWFGAVAFAVVVGAVVLVRPDFESLRLALGPPQSTLLQTALNKTAGAVPDLEKTFAGCVRGATASALSAAVPAAPLAATGMLIPGSAVLIVTASAIGCGVGAVSTATTDGASWVYRKGGEVRRWLFRSP
ncbi:hypothetical protein WCLP8_2700004 [uncultured Gammaproteobacteria bacterium]